ncbi:hypothetical protein A3A64_02535 [Candidatus Gottesmanbacteria bacterium RIFCSPLOWO2_01_FULL_48_11]|uniref:Uncharacterized protein n=1 Tax=Candidatus Gottesmanbacteria bacterium RIFCSPLOWO2_01_FULL_48_11 TaxID=1798395 RepID=A0A1F6ATD6_9BACT|nr:MAG: hypothetical protein A3A64_02535 [Candidatus Gottesmanbacteria bacterium RIFCSPLOWO2_01_FULL_48_11]
MYGEPLWPAPVDSAIGEGDIRTGRNLADYSYILRIDPRVLDGQVIVNFGAGKSTIAQQLASEAIHAGVIDVDLGYPKKSMLNRWTAAISGYVADVKALIRSNTKFSGSPTPQKHIYIQGDGRAMPLQDRIAFATLALFSTYQVPVESKPAVFGELMRVTHGVIHMAPIFGDDFTVLESMVESSGFQVVVCHPVRSHPRSLRFLEKPDDFWIENQEDYGRYVVRYPRKHRVIAPVSNRPQNSAFGAADVGGSVVVLQRIAE